MSRFLLLAAYFVFMNVHGVVAPSASILSGQNSSPAAFVAPLMAQEAEHAAEGEHAAAEGEHAAEGEGHGEEHSLLHEIFHYANFIVLAGALIYLIKKMLVPFLNERGRLIREDMQKSSEAIEQANTRLKAMEDRMGNLDRELAQLRDAGLNEARAERLRIEKEAEVEAGKILDTANMEMDSAVKAARQELQAFASQLALNVAEKKIKDGLTPQADKQILGAFINRLGSGADGDATGRKN
jgi:F-type H+-transporting ATPase subunit b